MRTWGKGTVLTLMLLLSFPNMTWSADTAAVAAALKDEASECRYLLRMCQEGRDIKRRSDESMVEVEAAKTSNDVNRMALATSAGRYLLNATVEKQGEVFEAMKVIRAKHDEMPKCFEQCSDVIPLKQFK